MQSCPRSCPAFPVSQEVVFSDSGTAGWALKVGMPSSFSDCEVWTASDFTLVFAGSREANLFISISE
jgi:hypothetical protein